jgi:transketolase
MNMRKQFVKTVEHLLKSDESTTLLLGDISVFGFKRAFEEVPKRVFNIGILEAATVSLAAGLAKTKLIPIVHTIAPFLVERAFEQIKIDFGYQKLGGNFVSVGSSYDYASLGCTHHCPGDIGILQNIPGMELIVPGTASEFDKLFNQAYANGRPTYYRLSERENENSQDVVFGKANLIKTGSLATVIAIGPTLDMVMSAVENLDVNLIYYTTLAPFDDLTLRNNFSKNGKLLIVEPFYTGTMTHQIIKATYPIPIMVDSIGVPREFLSNYGKAEEHDKAIGFTSANIHTRLEVLINE